ncbi:MAG: MFS transporter [Deltaproteobacteria bacterium]|nr:MFS transporter [Deltaproteobacteria bacterium]MBW2414016.1 MFS transporter [Deltaproteobacteria bacterium]
MTAATTSAEPPRGALSYPNYRRYWLASLAMVFGMQFRFIASGWLVHQLTDSPFWLGVPGLISAVVTILLTVPAGLLADRMDNQRLLAGGRGLTCLAHLALALLVVGEVVQVWMVLVWAGVTGVLAAVTNPAQNALLPRLIERPAMASAVALAAAIWNSMRIVGPATAGVLIAVVGIGQAFFVTTLGYAISTYLIWSLRLEPQAPHDHSEHGGGMLDGLRYIAAQPIFLATIGLSFFSSIFGRSYVVLLPIFADDVLNVGVRGFGYLEAAAGVGALIGTLSIVRVRAGRHTGNLMVGAALVFGLWIAAFTASRSLTLSMGLLFGGAFFASVYLNLGMTTLQLMVPDALRGRVMGIWGLTWFLSSAGGFFAATLAEFVGAPVAVAAGALTVSAFAAFVWVAFADIRTLPSREQMAA